MVWLDLILPIRSFAFTVGYALTRLCARVQSGAHASSDTNGDKSATGMLVITGSSDTRLIPSSDGLGTLQSSVESGTGDR